MTEIIKYVTSYIVTFKWEETPIEISNQAGEMLKKDLNSKDFVTINWNTYNKYEIKHIKKRTQEYDLYLKKKKYWLLNYKWDDIEYQIQKKEKQERILKFKKEQWI